MIHGGKNWLLNSGIQNLDKSSKAYGSFNAWYDEQRKRYSYAFSEITGYGISTLLFLNGLTPDRVLMERARVAADWLLLTAWDSKYGGFQCRYDHSTHTFNKRVCSFDAGTCLTALANLYQKTGEVKYHDGAVQVGNWLIQRMQKEDGSFYARIDTRTGTFIDEPVKWSSQSGSYHAKISIGLLNLFDATRTAKYEKSAIEICDWSLNLQDACGRFITNGQSRDTHLHPHCYSAEGLLFAGLVLGNKRYIASAASAMRWIKHHQLPSGGIPRTYRHRCFSRDESVDILSQTIRLWTLLKRVHRAIDEEASLAKAVDRLVRFRSSRRDKRSRGGFLYGYTDEGNFVNHVSSWGTMFAIQALDMYLARNEDISNLQCFI